MKNLKQPVRTLLLLFVIITSGYTSSFAQHQPHHKTEKVNAIKEKYLTEKTHLSVAQARSFWPVYEQYEKELRDLHQNYNQQYSRSKSSNMTEEQAKASIEASLTLQENIIRIKRKYNAQFLKIITARQLSALYNAEMDFKKILVDRLKTKKS